MQTSTPVAPAAAPSSLFDARLFLEETRPLRVREKSKNKKTIKREREKQEGVN